MINKCKRIFTTILFLTILCLILSIVSLIVKPKTNTKDAGFYHPTAYSIANEPTNTVDLLILGTSQAYCSFIPLEIWNDTGIPAYLCSTPSQPLYYTERLLHQAFENQSPPIVILETDAIFEKFDEIDVLKKSMTETFTLMKYHSRWKELTSEDFDFTYDYSQRDPHKGFVYDYRCKQVICSEYMIPNDETKLIPDINLYYLNQIIKFCEKKGTRLILVSCPSVANWDYSKHNAIEKISNEYDIEYIDMNISLNDLNLDWNNDWLDEGKHLNYYGALKLTKWFENYLLECKELTDKRNDPNYSSWNLDVEKIKAEIPK